MSKRFTATEKWNDPWFRRLTPDVKLFWLYMVDSCDCAGFWIVDFELASFLIGKQISKKMVFNSLSERITDHGDVWEINKFINFQYGNLSKDCKAHKPILDRIENQRVSKGYPKGINTLVEVEEEEVMEKEVVKEVEKNNKKDLTECQKFVESFAKYYQSITGHSFSTSKKHYIIAASLIKKNGYDACVSKAKILAKMCQDGSVWFCKEGMIDFTIEKLSSQWNSIIEIEKMDESTIRSIRIVNNLRKQRGEDELPISAFAGTGVKQIAGTSICSPGQTVVGKQVEYLGGGVIKDRDTVSCDGEGDEDDDDQ